MARVLAGIIFGLICALLWPSLPLPWVGWSLLLVAMVIFTRAHFIAACLLGTSLCILLLNHQFKDLPYLLSANSSIKGTIISLPVQGKFSNRFKLRITQIKTKLDTYASNAIVLVYWPGIITLKQGQIIEFRARGRPVHGLANQGAFNYQRWLVGSGVCATLSVIDGEVVGRKISQRERVRQQLLPHLASLSHGQYIMALAIGSKDQFSEKDWDTLKHTGTGHLFAISGLHLSLVALTSFWLFYHMLKTTMSVNYIQSLKLLSLIFSLGVCYGYAYLAGFSLPTQRALVMLVILFAFTLLKQRVGLSGKLTLCMAVILLLNPSGMLSVSFWLSFCAVSLIYLMVTTGPVSLANDADLGIVDRFKAWCWLLCKMQCWLFVGLMAINTVFFQGIALTSPLANLIAVPLVSLLILPLVLCGLLAELLLAGNMLAIFAFESANLLLAGLFYFLDFLANLHYSWLALAPPNYQWLALLMWLVLFSHWLGVNRAQRYLYLVGFSCFFSVGLHLWLTRIDEGRWRVSFLDVGQGNAAVVIKNDRAIVIDTGDIFSSGQSVASRIVQPFLQYHQIKELSYIIVSHDDRDHAGGLSYLAKANPQAQLISNQVSMSGFSTTRCDNSDSTLLWQGLTLRFSKMPDEQARSDNDRSCLVHIGDGRHSVLFTGDIQKKAEAYHRQELDQSWQANVLQVAHHGSKTSSAVEFISMIKPEIAIVSASRFNQWHFPHQQTLTRFKNSDAMLYNTAQLGQITVHMGGKGIKVSTYRTDIAPFWYNRDLSFGHYR